MNCLITLTVMVYNLAIVSGCSYLVFWRGHSGWWFVVAVLFLAKTDSANSK